jgi:hypothetical protein
MDRDGDGAEDGEMERKEKKRKKRKKTVEPKATDSVSCYMVNELLCC